MIWIVTGMGFTKPPKKKLHLKKNGWKMIPSFWVSAYFQVLLLLVSGRVFSSWFGGFHKTILQGGPELKMTFQP